MLEVWFAPEGKGLVTCYMGTGPPILMIGLALHHLLSPPTSLLLASYFPFLPFFFPPVSFLSSMYINFPFSIYRLTILFVSVGRREPMTESLGLPREKISHVRIKVIGAIATMPLGNSFFSSPF